MKLFSSSRKLSQSSSVVSRNQTVISVTCMRTRNVGGERAKTYISIKITIELKKNDPSFQISNFVSFSSTSTRSGSAVQLIHKHSRTSLAHHSYFHRFVRSIFAEIALFLNTANTNTSLCMISIKKAFIHLRY